MTKSILILGKNGFVGAHLISYLNNAKKWKVTAIGRDKNEFGESLDFTDEQTCIDQLKHISNRVSYDVIVNCIAVISAKECRDNRSFATLVNATLPRFLCETFPNSKLIHISTDSVYAGLKYENRVGHGVMPLTHYGYTKALGDLNIMMFSNDYAIIRCTPVGMSHKENSFLDWIVNSSKSEKEITLFNDVLFSPVSIRQVAKLIGLIADGVVEDRIIDFGGVEQLSKLDFGIMLLEHCKLPTDRVKSVRARDIIDPSLLNGTDQRIQYQGISKAVKELINEKLIKNIYYDKSW